MSITLGKNFNKWFSTVLMTLMVLVIGVITAIKLGQEGTNKVMLIVAALGSVMGVVSTVLSANGIIWTFLFGFLDVSIYCIVAADNGVWGTFLLHLLYFIPMQFVGLWQWKKRGAKGVSHEVKTRRLGGKQRLVVVGGSLIALSVIYFILVQIKIHTVGEDFVHSRVVLDALVTTCNIAGQILMSLAFYESWYFWILVNISSIFLWGGLMLDASSGYTVVMFIKYCFYLVNSLNGLRIWKSNIF